MTYLELEDDKERLGCEQRRPPLHAPGHGKGKKLGFCQLEREKSLHPSSRLGYKSLQLEIREVLLLKGATDRKYAQNTFSECHGKALPVRPKTYAKHLEQIETNQRTI